MRRSSLDGLRILLVEDEYLPAIEAAEMLDALGATVVGPVPDLESAFAIVSGGSIDAAILDVNLRGEPVFPVADQLLARKTPFLFATGYDEWVLPERFRGYPRLTKPFDQMSLERVARAALLRPTGTGES